MLDYYLAPGVAKTFIKKYVELLEDKYEIPQSNAQELKEALRTYRKNNKTILDDKGKEFVRATTVALVQTLRVDAPFFNSVAFQKVWDKAMEKTNRQTYQAMENFVHNLNTMHSRAGKMTAV